MDVVTLDCRRTQAGTSTDEVLFRINGNTADRQTTGSEIHQQMTED